MTESDVDLSSFLPLGVVPEDGVARLKRRATQRARVRRAAAAGMATLLIVVVGVLSAHSSAVHQQVAQSPVSSPPTSTPAGISTTTAPTGDYTTTTSLTTRDWVGTRFTATPAGLKEEGEINANLANGTAVLISEVSDSNRSYFWSSRQIGTSGGRPEWEVISSLPLSGVDPPACIGTCVSSNGVPGDTTVALFASRFGNGPAMSAWTMNPKSGVLDPTDALVWTRM